MHNQSRNIKKSVQSEDAIKLHTKIKETWTELSDDIIRLYEEKPDRFFAVLEKKYAISKNDAQEIIRHFKD